MVHVLTPGLLLIGGGMLTWRMLRPTLSARTITAPRDPPPSPARTGRATRPRPAVVAAPASPPDENRLRPPTPDACAAIMAAMTGPGLCTPPAPLSPIQE